MARDFPDRGLMAPTFSLSVAAAEAGEPFLLLFAALRPDLGAGDHMLRTAFIIGEEKGGRTSLNVRVQGFTKLV